jgi:hypothetical protein
MGPQVSRTFPPASTCKSRWERVDRETRPRRCVIVPTPIITLRSRSGNNFLWTRTVASIRMTPRVERRIREQFRMILVHHRETHQLAPLCNNPPPFLRDLHITLLRSPHRAHRLEVRRPSVQVNLSKGVRPVFASRAPSNCLLPVHHR